MGLYKLVWLVAIFIIVFSLMFYALQSIDFSKIIKKNSTTQIKIIIVFTSAGIAFMIAIGIINIMELIGNII